MDAKQLVQLAMEKSEPQTPAGLARKLQLTAYESPKRVKRWLAGTNEPNYSETMALLAIAGRLSDEPGDSAAADLVLAERATAILAADLEHLATVFQA